MINLIYEDNLVNLACAISLDAQQQNVRRIMDYNHSFPCGEHDRHLTLRITAAEPVETSVTTTWNSLSQDYATPRQSRFANIFVCSWVSTKLSIGISARKRRCNETRLMILRASL